MKRTKAPVLTSPSKIGFFVSLMLVSVSIGVTYFFTRRLGVTWNILDRNWLDRNEWLGVIRGEGFLFEILPLVGLVAIASMFAYIVISGAVRNYKRYLDSGCDYRALLSSLKDLEGLEDKRKIERIKNHPELKRLLLGMMETLEEREKLLSEREGALETRLEDSLESRETELTDGFIEECGRLMKAVESGKLEPSAIEFSNPGLRQLAEVMERALQGVQEPTKPGPETDGNFKETNRVLHAKLQETAGELRMAREGAQGIEARIRELVASGEGEAGKPRLDAARKEIKAVVASLSSLEQLNLTIDALSEEARGIAINTALHAGSGAGSQDDLIRLAEEVKEIAARFKEAARRFAQTSSTMRTSAGILDTIAGEPIERPGPAGRPEEDLAGILSRVSLWVERVVVLSDKVSNLAASYDVSVSTLRETVSKDRVEEAVTEEASVEEAVGGGAEEFGFESLDRSRALFGDTGESIEEGLERSQAGERVFFKEMPPAPERTPDEDRENMLDETERGDGEDRREERGGEPTADRFGTPVKDRLSEESASAPAQKGVPPMMGDEHFPLDGDQEEMDGDEAADTEAVEEPTAGNADIENAASEEGREAPVEDTEAAEPEEEPVDLYTLGAVDYDPALHG